MNQVSGSIIHIGNTETVGSKGTFKKRLLVIKTDEQYPQEIPVDFVQDKCDLLDAFALGEDVIVKFTVKGNPYNGKWYCSLNGFEIF
jgi:hypothetical protein